MSINYLTENNPYHKNIWINGRKCSKIRDTAVKPDKSDTKWTYEQHDLNGYINERALSTME